MKREVVCAVAALVSTNCCYNVWGGALKKSFEKNEPKQIEIEGHKGGASAESPSASGGQSLPEPASSSQESSTEATRHTSEPASVADGNASGPSAAQQVVSGGHAKKIIGDPVVARVNGKDIRRSQVLKLIAQLPPAVMHSVPPDKVFELLREQALRMKLIVDQAKKAGLDKSKEYIEQLELVRQELLMREYMMRTFGPRVSDESARKAAYTRYLVEFKKEIQFQLYHIMVDSEEKAKKVQDRLSNGDDFSKVANEDSVASSKTRGGEEGYVAVSMLPPVVKSAIVMLKDGESTIKGVKIENHWHFFKVGGRKETAPVNFEDARNMLEQRIMQDEMSKELDRLEKQAKVERYNEDGTPATKPSTDATAG
ncbi:MAG: peptidylprolyl isomerase [Holosporaceae bacterium]|jgi:peptidyl-prolyl cis-trans isomerase C|nr:peptidylprolyl isomerase [Holosporaceae bacterium]